MAPIYEIGVLCTMNLCRMLSAKRYLDIFELDLGACIEDLCFPFVFWLVPNVPFAFEVVLVYGLEYFLFG